MSDKHCYRGVSAMGLVLALAACNEKPSEAPAPAVSKSPVASASSSMPAKDDTPPPAPGGIKNVPQDGELTVDVAASTLGWTDSKITEADHAQFKKYEATLGIKDGKPTTLTFTLKSASLEVKDKPALATVAKNESLDSASNLKASFISESVTPSKTPNEYDVEGKITFRMTTKPISFPMTVETRGTDFRVKGQMSFVGANFGASGTLGIPFELVFPFPN